MGPNAVGIAIKLGIRLKVNVRLVARTSKQVTHTAGVSLGVYVKIGGYCSSPARADIGVNSTRGRVCQGVSGTAIHVFEVGSCGSLVLIADGCASACIVTGCTRGAGHGAHNHLVDSFDVGLLHGPGKCRNGGEIKRCGLKGMQLGRKVSTDTTHVAAGKVIFRFQVHQFGKQSPATERSGGRGQGVCPSAMAGRANSGHGFVAPSVQIHHRESCTGDGVKGIKLDEVGCADSCIGGVRRRGQCTGAIGVVAGAELDAVGTYVPFRLRVDGSFHIER